MPAAKASPAPLTPAMALAGAATEPSGACAPSRPPATAPSGKVRRRPSASRRVRARRRWRADRRDVGRAVGAARGDPGQRADLEVVDDEKIEMRQARPAELGEPFGRGGHQFEIGREAGGARLAQHGDPAVGLAPPRDVHRLMRARQAKMEDSRAGRGEVEMVRRSSRRRRPDGRNASAGRCRAR